MGKAFNLAGFPKEVAASTAQVSNFSESVSDVVNAFDLFNSETSGFKGKINTIKDGFSKGAKSIVSGLSSVGKTALKFVKTPLGALTVGVAAVTTGYNVYKKLQENGYKKATNQSNEWAERDKTLTDQIAQYEQLKTQLDSGTLSAQEEYNIRSQILDIQNQIVDTYGSQVSGIDLVNGSLQTQLDLLQQIRSDDQSDAQKFLDDNSGFFAGATTAKKKMESEDTYSIVSGLQSGTEQTKTIDKAIDEVNKKFGEEILKADINNLTGEYQLNFTGNVTEANDVLTTFRNTLKDIESESGQKGQGLFDNIYDGIANNIKTNDDIIDKWQDLYDQTRKAELLTDKTQYGPGDNQKKATEWLKDYSEAVNNYNDALTSGSQSSIDTAREAYQNTFDSLPKDLKNTYQPEIDEITDSLDEANVKKNEFSQGLRGADGYDKDLKKTADAVKALNLDEDGLLNLIQPGSKNISKDLQSLIDTAKEAGVITGTSSVDELTPLISLLGELGVVSVNAASKIDTTALSAEQLAEKVTAAQTVISNVNSAISASNTDAGLSSDNMSAIAESFGKLDNYNAGALFTNTAKGIKMNSDALKDLIQAQHDADSKDLETRIKGQNEELLKQNRILKDAEKQNDQGAANAAKEQIANIQAAIDMMEQGRSQLFASYQQQMKEVSDFQAIQNAKSTANAGNQYDSMVNEIETAKKAFDNGLTNTDDFKSVAKYLSPYGFDDADNFVENYKKATRYFTDDQSGIINFLTDLQSKGLATLNTLSDGTQQWTTTFGDAEEAAKQMYMGQEWFNDMFDKAEEYGAFNSFISSAEEGKLQIEDIATKLADAKTKMAELQAQGADQYALDDQQAVIDKYTAQLESSHKALDDYTANSGKKYAEELQTAKKQLDQMSKDIADESDSNVRKQLENNFDALAKKYGIDTKDYAVDEKSYRKKMDSLGINTWENPASAKDMGFEKGTQEAKDYTSAVKTLKKAHEENDSAMEQAFNTLSNYNAEQLEGIKLGDGAYNVDGLKDAEDALQHIADQTGLTKEQIVSALQGLGVLKIDTDTTDLTKLNEEATTAQEKLNELTGSTYKFDFDTSDLDTINKQIEDAKEQLALFQTTDSEGNKHIDYSQEGAKEAATVYEASIRQQQNTEYGNSSISQVDTSSIEGTTRDCIVAAQQFMQAKNEMDIQTQLAQEGAENTLDDATQKCQTAYENLQTVAKDNNIDIDTSDIQTAEDELLGLTNQDLSTKFNVDISELDTALSEVQQLQSEGKINSQINLDINADTMSIDDIDAKIQELTNEKKSLIIQNDIEGADKVQNLINCLQELKDKNVSIVAATEGVDLVNQLQERISELQNKNVSIDAIVQDAEVSDLVAQIAALPEEVQIAIGVDESNVGNAEAIKAQIESDPASVSVNYTKGDQEEAEDKEADVNYTLGSQDPPNDKTAKVTYTLGYQAPPSDKVAHVTYIGGKASGTMTSIAHADGTMHNAPWNYQRLTPAHANGNVALKHDEKALVNEVQKNGHSESIVRDGVWSLIPGGAHFENLKKGDIIFSAAQTDALLKYGAISGHARTYAKGSLEGSGVVNLTPAHYTTGSSSLTIKKPISTSSSENSGNSGNSGLQHAIEDNTDAVSNNSDDTSDAADEVSEALQNVIKKLNDNAMDWVEVAMDRLDRITSRYTDLAESDYSHYTKAQKYYNKALENTDKEIKAAKESISVYKRKSEEIANNGEVSKYLTPALKKKVQDGTINIETLDANQKAAVEAYKQWYDKYLDAVQKYRDKKTQKLDLAKSKVDNVYDSYDLIISKRKAKEEYYAAKAENRIKSGKSQKVGSVYWKDLEKQVSYAQYQKDWMLKERDKVQQSMTDYLNVNGHNKKDKAYQEMKKNLTDLNTSIVEADTHIQEAKAALEETRENLKQWQIDRWERAGDKQDASLSYKKNADDINYQLSANDYEERLKTYDKIIRADEKKRQLLAEEIATKTWSNKETQKKIEEYDNLTASIIKSKEAMQQLAQEEIDFRFKPLDEAQNKLSNLVSELQIAQKLLGDTESFYNDDGAFSTNGLTNILLVQEQIDATKDKIANYREGLNKLDEMYKNGAIGPEYYKTKTDEMLKSLQQESATLADLKQNLLDMYTTQITKENDLLQENIEKRKDALAAKEKYYDYDKTLKKKTKDINTLKAQIAALEGTSNAASKARLEKLRAELADAEDDMADTMHQHEVDMKNTGYENFSDEANKALDNTLDAVKKNAAFQEAIIGSMLSNVKANYDSTYKHLGDVMDQYGMKVSQTYSQMITKAADFNTAAVNATKAWEGVTKIDTSKPYGGSIAGNNAFNNAMNNAGSSQTAGSPNIKPDTDYTLKLSDTDIYLTYSHIKKQLKATWSPKKPEHSDIEWKSSDESIAKVSSDGTVRGVSSGLDKNGLMARDESKTRKCIITAIGGGGLAKATCTVHVMPDSHYEKIKDYADRAGKLTTSGDNLRDAMEYAYQNGANHSDQSYTAVEGFKKAYLKDWTNSLSDRPDGATDIPAGVSPLIGYFNAKGKKVGPKEMQQLADILQINTPGVKNYDSWGSTLKNKILKAYKSYGFSKGGVVRKGIPASILDMIGGDALIPRGDSMLIGANPGETVLTKEFTDQLKPTVATLNEFNARMAKPITPILPSSSNDTTVNSECNITINVDKINSEQDIKKLAYQIGDIITERNKRDWKKVR
mgnify:CR=1 FL=1